MSRQPVESAQYVNIRYREQLAEAGIAPSVGSRGDSYDNAMAETINGLYKAQVIQRRVPWRTEQSVEMVTLEGVSWFNPPGLLDPIDHLTPTRAETLLSASHQSGRHRDLT